MTTLVLHPLDTLFFRDGRPYNQDDPGQAETGTLFPPYPPTIVGAMRAASARAMGWPRARWNSAALGDGVDWQAGDEPLGPLRFAGPHVLRNGEPLFPAPLNLVAGKDGTGTELVTALAPSHRALDTDLGPVRLPEPVRPGQGFKILEGFWLETSAMAQALNWEGLNADCAISSTKLRQAEARIGIQRDAVRRTTAERALYASAHSRLALGVVLAVEVEGLPDVSLDGNLAPLGGEGRSVWIERRDEKVRLPQLPDLRAGKDGVLRYSVALITPADLGEEWPRSGDTLSDSAGQVLPGHVVSACVGRAVPVGGWDGAGRRPLPLRPLIPAGSLWFLEANGDEADAAKSWHGRAIGRSAGWGFGRVLIGRWERAGEET